MADAAKLEADSRRSGGAVALFLVAATIFGFAAVMFLVDLAVARLLSWTALLFSLWLFAIAVFFFWLSSHSTQLRLSSVLCVVTACGSLFLQAVDGPEVSWLAIAGWLAIAAAALVTSGANLARVRKLQFSVEFGLAIVATLPWLPSLVSVVRRP